MNTSKTLINKRIAGVATTDRLRANILGNTITHMYASREYLNSMSPMLKDMEYITMEIVQFTNKTHNILFLVIQMLYFKGNIMAM